MGITLFGGGLRMVSVMILVKIDMCESDSPDLLSVNITRLSCAAYLSTGDTMK